MLNSEYDFVKRYLRLALANVLSNIMVPLANLVSVIFLGHLKEIHHLVGAVLAGTLLNFLYMVLTFLRMGTTGITAQAVGRDDREAVLLVGLRNGLIALLLGILIVLLQYPLGELGFALLNLTPEVKASGQAYFNTQIWGAPAVLLNFVLIGWFLGQEKNGAVVVLSVVGNAAKIALDYLLIIRWGWASMGAGVSYAISQYLTLLVGLIFLCKEVQWQEVREVAPKIGNISAIRSTLALNGNIFVSNFLIFFATFTFRYEGVQMGTIIYAQNALLMQVCVLNSYIAEGLGFGTATLAGNFKGKGASQQLVPLAKVSGLSSLLVGLFFGGVCWLFPDTVFGFLTNHVEVTENIDIFVPWVLLIMVCVDIDWSLEGYFLGLASANTLRNVSLVAILVGFAPTAFAASKFESNHLLWLALSLFYGIRMVMLAVQLFRTVVSDVEDGSVSIPTITGKLQVGPDEKSLVN